MKSLQKAALILTLVLFAGCSTGPGINRHQFFDKDSLPALPVKINIDEGTKKYESGAIMGEGAEMQAFIAGGLPAMYLSVDKEAVSGIRGKFLVGDVFYNFASRISFQGISNQQNYMELKLNYFQQYLIPGMAPRLKAIIEFSSRLNNSDQKVHSAYMFDWEGQGPILSPNKEKDMLREMVEQVLIHWSDAFNKQHSRKGSAISFPRAERGQYSGIGVKCKYHIFYPL